MCGTHCLPLSCGLFAYRAVPYSLQSPPLKAAASSPAPLVAYPSARCCTCRFMFALQQAWSAETLVFLSVILITTLQGCTIRRRIDSIRRIRYAYRMAMHLACRIVALRYGCINTIYHLFTTYLHLLIPIRSYSLLLIPIYSY